MARLKPLSGFPEFLPSGQMVENHVTRILEETFELHGFAPVSYTHLTLPTNREV